MGFYVELMKIIFELSPVTFAIWFTTDLACANDTVSGNTVR